VTEASVCSGGQDDTTHFAMHCKCVKYIFFQFRRHNKRPHPPPFFVAGSVIKVKLGTNQAKVLRYKEYPVIYR